MTKASSDVRIITEIKPKVEETRMALINSGLNFVTWVVSKKDKKIVREKPNMPNNGIGMPKG